ncbi:MAG: hypothetical protein AVDCRST_MAG89-881, partial [uncultured Gemmatimonadetes bacterium]
GEDPAHPATARGRRSVPRPARAGDGQPALHPRNDGARRQLYRRVRLGPGGDRRGGGAGGVAGLAAAVARKLAGDVDRGRAGVPAHRPADLGHQGPPRQGEPAYRPGAQVRAQPGTAPGRGRRAYRRSLSRGARERASRDVAAAVRCGHRGRRRVLRQGRARDGHVLHGRGGGGALLTRGVGRRVHGGGLRRASHGVRLSDRPEARWL